MAAAPNKMDLADLILKRYEDYKISFFLSCTPTTQNHSSNTHGIVLPRIQMIASYMEQQTSHQLDCAPFQRTLYVNFLKYLIIRLASCTESIGGKKTRRNFFYQNVNQNCSLYFYFISVDSIACNNSIQSLREEKSDYYWFYCIHVEYFNFF